jgi:hypothetical protein
MSGYNRYYFSNKYKSRSEALLAGVKCVFISYQKTDRDHAQRVGDYLLNAGIDVYIDLNDTELRIHHQNNDPKKVTDAICKGINNSSHMLVIISPSTAQSSWVPFEIGYGYEKTDLSVLCLKGIPRGRLPEYVRTANVVRDIYDLNNLVASFTGLTKDRLVENKAIFNESSNSNPLFDVMDSLIVD